MAIQINTAMDNFSQSSAGAEGETETRTATHINIGNNFVLMFEPTTLYFNDQLVTEIQPKVMKLLMLLAHNANSLVTHEQIVTEIWEGNFYVGKQGIIRTMSKLREILKSDTTDIALIESHYGKGYVLRAEHKPSQYFSLLSKIELYGPVFLLLTGLYLLTTFL